jgi:S-adenosyl methyltransferase
MGMTGDPLEVFRPDIPSAARMYDYYLGGKDNYPADRAATEQVISMMPPGTIRTAALQNRRFLGRAVRYLVNEAGIRQFLDVGTGLPTMESVHEVANSIAPDDLGRPVAVLLVAVLHFLRDLDDPRGIIRRLMEAMPPGSYLVISHATADSYPEFDAATGLQDDPGRSLCWCGVARKRA